MEHEKPINDLIDVGALDAGGDYLYLAKHRISEDESDIMVSVPALPAKAGIDPLNKLVDRKPNDNLTPVDRL